MKFTIKEDQGQVAQIVVEGCLNSADISPPLDPFRAVLGPTVYQRTVLLDMGQSNYLDSMCIGWLLSSHKRFKDQGGKLVIHSLQPMAAQVIQLLRLHNVFQTASDTTSALQLVRGEVA